MLDFLFKHKENKKLSRPFTYLQESIGTETVKILLLLIIQLIMLLLSKSFSALIVIFSAIIGTVSAQVIISKFFKIKKSGYFILITNIVEGILIGMFIPETYPPVTVFFATLVTMFAVKHCFVGFANAWANPIACTVILLWFIGFPLFPDFQISIDLLKSRNPSQLFLESGVIPFQSYDGTLTEALNGTLFKIFKVSIPEGYVSFFWDTHSVIPAFRYNFITLISSIFIFNKNPINIISPSIFITFYMLLNRLAAPFFYDGIVFQGDMLLALLTSGTLFTVTFVLNWYGTIPCSVGGKAVYGFIGAVAAFFISGVGTSSCGMMFTVLVLNIVSVAIQSFEDSMDKKAMQKIIKTLKTV